jgi:hypothetical protein
MFRLSPIRNHRYIFSVDGKAMDYHEYHNVVIENPFLPSVQIFNIFAIIYTNKATDIIFSNFLLS